jgi:hypothetical protein
VSPLVNNTKTGASTAPRNNPRQLIAIPDLIPESRFSTQTIKHHCLTTDFDIDSGTVT